MPLHHARLCALDVAIGHPNSCATQTSLKRESLCRKETCVDPGKHAFREIHGLFNFPDGKRDLTSEATYSATSLKVLSINNSKIMGDGVTLLEGPAKQILTLASDKFFKFHTKLIVQDLCRAFWVLEGISETAELSFHFLFAKSGDERSLVRKLKHRRERGYGVLQRVLNVAHSYSWSQTLPSSANFP